MIVSPSLVSANSFVITQSPATLRAARFVTLEIVSAETGVAEPPLWYRSVQYPVDLVNWLVSATLRATLTKPESRETMLNGAANSSISSTTGRKICAVLSGPIAGILAFRNIVESCSDSTHLCEAQYAAAAS